MKTSLAPAAVLALVLLALLATPGISDTPSWSSFTSALFSRVYLTQSSSNGGVVQTISWGNDPRVVFGGSMYKVQWIRGYFVVSKDGVTGFTATNGTTATAWDWVNVGSPGQVAGWLGLEEDSLAVGLQRSFNFGALSATEDNALTGLCVGYETGGQTRCGYFKGRVPTTTVGFVPEPSSLAALSGALMGCYAMRRRRR